MRPKGELTLFELIFVENDNGDLTPRTPLRIEGVNFLPGASFGPDYKPYGVPLREWYGHFIYGNFDEGVLVLDAVARR